MAKVVFIGAGSLGFTRGLVRDLLTYPLFADATIGLVDIHEGRLEMAHKGCQRVVDAGGYAATVESSTDRRKMLADADAVCITILCGNCDIWQHDILIPKKYGVDTNVGDTRGPSGIFRALRTMPEMLSICRDIEELCPRAVVLNYTNPMAMLCHAMQRETKVNVTGLCHSVQGTAHMLAKWAGVPGDEVDYVCGGINHLSWYVRFEHRGQDLYPVLRKAVRENDEVYNEEQVRNEMFKAFGYYVTESSGHNSEYNWWFPGKREDLIEKYCTHGTGWNPGRYAYILDEYRSREGKWHQDFEDWLNSPDWDDAEKTAERLKRGNEYASGIFNAYLGGDMYRFNGNVTNSGEVTNLPLGCCVEIPVLASRGRIQPMHVGALPPQVVPLTATSAMIEMMAVEGGITGDAELVYQAICNDPLTASVLSLAEIRDMVREMFEINRPHLPTFSEVNI